MKVSDIEAILTPAHNVCIEIPPANQSRAFYARDSFYVGKASDIPDNLKSADVINIEADDFMKLIIQVNKGGTF